LELTRRLAEIADLGLPMLAAVSNKDFMGEATGLPRSDRIAPSIAVATICALSGARILRMHNVTASVAAARMIEAVMGFRQPPYLHHNMG
jgi:dihydropteroate synthase